jgi:cytochrome c-type biogenesis protein CcmH/NrfG
LLNQVKKHFQTENELYSKKDLDAYVIDQLTSAFEEARQVLVAQIEERREEAERQQIERERQRVIADEKRKVRNKKIKKCTVAAIVICAIALFTGVIWNNKKE